MFVRWKRRKVRTDTRRFNRHQGDALVAVLVRSEREGARVRQRFVCHLASIREKYITVGGHPIGFWQNATAKLEELGLDSALRARIEAQLERRVPRPVPGACEERLRQLEAIIRGRP